MTGDEAARLLNHFGYLLARTDTPFKPGDVIPETECVGEPRASVLVLAPASAEEVELYAKTMVAWGMPDYDAGIKRRFPFAYKVLVD